MDDMARALISYKIHFYTHNNRTMQVKDKKKVIPYTSPRREKLLGESASSYVYGGFFKYIYIYIYSDVQMCLCLKRK